MDFVGIPLLGCGVNGLRCCILWAFGKLCCAFLLQSFWAFSPFTVSIISLIDFCGLGVLLICMGILTVAILYNGRILCNGTASLYTVAF
jgi:hypothetical protein